MKVARDFWSLVLHDLQGLGSLTKIWRYYFSDTCDNKYKLAARILR
jgi:hypothetical protein